MSRSESEQSISEWGRVDLSGVEQVEWSRVGQSGVQQIRVGQRSSELGRVDHFRSDWDRVGQSWGRINQIGTE